MADSMMMGDAKRASLEVRIMEQLQHLDENTLRDLDAWLNQPSSGPRRGLTRRQMLTATLLGGVAIAGAGAGGSMLNRGREMVGGVAETAQTVGDIGDTVAQWQSYAEGLGSQLAGATDLVNLYEQMDRIGLDDVVARGLSVVAALLGRGAQAAATLRDGLTSAKNHINQFDEGLAVIDGGLARAEQTIGTLSLLFQALEDRLKSATEPTRPITDALGGFFTSLLSKIPFGVGDAILETISRIQAVIGAIPESIQNINNDLIHPLRERFFPRDASGDVQVRLLEPLTGFLFRPAELLLATLEELGTTWMNAMEQPAREKIVAREAIRQEISKKRAALPALPTTPTQ